MEATTSCRTGSGTFEELALAQMDGLHSLAYHLTHNAADAEDLVQETVLRAYRYFEQFSDGTNFRAWIFRILRNLAINRYRKERQRGADVNLDTVSHRLEGPSYGMARRGGRMFMTADLDHALERLPNDYRSAVMLSFVCGFSYREIADIMACPIGTVMSRISRARRQLQDDLLGSATSVRRSAA